MPTEAASEVLIRVGYVHETGQVVIDLGVTTQYLGCNADTARRVGLELVNAAAIADAAKHADRSNMTDGGGEMAER